jgi:hypothetical protein
LALAGILGLCTAGVSMGVVGSTMMVMLATNSQEVPPTVSSAIGGGYAIIDTDANTLTYHISFTGLTSAETAAHFHGPAAPGSNAGVLVALPPGNPKVGVWNYPEIREADILAGRIYMNIHTSNNPGGEIRAQLVSQAGLADQAQEVPPTGSSASGFGLAVIDRAANTLSYYIAFTGLSSAETAAHIHGFALHGTNAGVLQALPSGSPKVGVWNYTDAQEEQVLSGQIYYNIHSVNFPGGEIRGQLVPIVVPMDGAQEVPPTPSTGAGIGQVAYDAVTDNLSYELFFSTLTAPETAAHIHGWAPPGVNAGVLHSIALGTPVVGVWNYGNPNETNLFSDLAYMNVHTSNFAGGEIRGQIIGSWVPPTSSVGNGQIVSFKLAQNAPNPFQNSTRIDFSLARSAPVRLSVYDTQGRVVRSLANGEFSQGLHAVRWDGVDDAGRSVASGVYRYVLQTPDGSKAGSLTLLK